MKEDKATVAAMQEINALENLVAWMEDGLVAVHYERRQNKECCADFIEGRRGFPSKDLEWVKSDEENGVAYYAAKGSKVWDDRALQYAEKIGVCEYKVNGRLMEYWSFYGSEGWYFVRYDLAEGKEVFRGANIPWVKELGVPAFLKNESGATLYNYMAG